VNGDELEGYNPLTVKELELWAAQVTHPVPRFKNTQHTAAVVAAVEFICSLGGEEGR
jgi:hypothetical protein